MICLQERERERERKIEIECEMLAARAKDADECELVAMINNVQINNAAGRCGGGGDNPAEYAPS